MAMVSISALAEEYRGTIPEDELQRLDEEIASVQREVMSTIRALSIRPPAFSDLLAGLVAAPRLNAALPLFATGVLTHLLGAWLSRGRTAPPIGISLFAHLGALTIGFAIAAGVVAVLALDPLPRRDIGSSDMLACMVVQASYLRHFALRWITLPGPFLGSALSLFLLGLWYLVRATDNSPRKCLRLLRTEPARLWAGVLTCLGRPALALGGSLLLMYLLAAPAAVRLAETTYQQTIAPIRDPEAYWASVERRVAEIEQDGR